MLYNSEMKTQNYSIRVMHGVQVLVSSGYYNCYNSDNLSQSFFLYVQDPLEDQQTC